MFGKRSLKSLFVLLAALTAAIGLATGYPWKGIGPASAQPGQTVSVTVALNATATQDTPVSVAGNTNISSAPPSVTVPAGTDRTSFSVTVSDSASGNAEVDMWNSGGSASAIFPVIAQKP